MKKRLLVLSALALPVSILPTAAMAQDAIDALGGVGINCSMPGSFCTSTKTTITSSSDGGTTKTSESTQTIGGVRVDDDDAPKARKPIQPARDNSPYPGMHYDPALGYYVPNTPQ